MYEVQDHHATSHIVGVGTEMVWTSEIITVIRAGEHDSAQVLLASAGARKVGARSSAENTR